MDLSLKDRTVFVAGGSRGIGLSIARAFASEGARVAISARGSDGLAQAAAMMGVPDRVVTIAADMTDEAQVQRAISEVEQALGPITIYVANVGNGSAPAGAIVPRKDWERSMDTNFLGAMSLAGAAAERLVKRKGGCLLFVSSIAGLEAIGAPAPYASAKAALQAAVKSLARTLGPSGVRVNAIAPGNVYFEGGTWEEKMKADRDNVNTMLEREVALRRFGEPEEIANVAVFLASDRASFVTGATWIVDGGQTRSFF